MKNLKLMLALGLFMGMLGTSALSLSEEKLVAVAPGPMDKYFNKGTLYTITTKVDKKDYALTVVMNSGKKPFEVNGSTATIQLTPFDSKKIEDGQLWDPHVVEINEKAWGPYYLYSRISQNKKYATHLLALNDFKRDFSSSKSNTFGITHNTNDARLIWMIQKLVNGKFRIASHYGIESQINQKDEAPSDYKWDQVRCVEATSGGKLKHMPISNSPGQQWEIKETSARFAE
jgi:hypothetical protein